MAMTKSEQAAYHLDVQQREINEMSTRTEPFEYTVAGVDLTVLPKVYPGGIDSELTCEAIGDTTNKSVLDLCTGTGIVAVKAALGGASSVVAVDLNPEAVKNAKTNAQKFNLSQIDVREGSLFEPVRGERFDIVAVNPPYTGKKPKNKTEICFWDEDNMTTRQFFEQYRQHLNPGGQAYLAWADFSSVELVERLASATATRLELVQSRSTKSGLATFLVYRLIS
ncbi:MAG: release factor glutamine methyltransferase [Patescibacteria group bacterium]|jgi:release factor glutamine methyltransferase|nr:release factor glutamine methyltransferase [Patescibacteria group bacterium]